MAVVKVVFGQWDLYVYIYMVLRVGIILDQCRAANEGFVYAYIFCDLLVSLAARCSVTSPALDATTHDTTSAILFFSTQLHAYIKQKYTKKETHTFKKAFAMSRA